MPRYIDADDLRDNVLNDNTYDNDTVNYYLGWIDDAPAADVVPVVRGEWILVGTNGHDYETSVEEECSLCGRYVYRYDTQPQDNFCPNCGADMRGAT